MNNKKKIISIALIISAILCIVSALLYNLTINRVIPFGPGPIVIKEAEPCADYCTNLKDIEVYIAIRTEEQCKQVNGIPVYYSDMVGKMTFGACSPKTNSQ